MKSRQREDGTVPFRVMGAVFCAAQSRFGGDREIGTESSVPGRGGESLTDPSVVRRAQAVILGQLAGDALGSVVEFLDRDAIARAYPEGVDLVSSPVWGTLPGQPTDDSELALALGWALAEAGGGGYPDDHVARAYRAWFDSGAFDCGRTMRTALAAIPTGGCGFAEASRRAASPTSEANGALMRQSPLAVWGWRLDAGALCDAVRRDTTLTHPHPVCQASSCVYVVTLAELVREGLDARAAYRRALEVADATAAPESVQRALRDAWTSAPVCDGPHQGHVVIALQNAFHQLLHATSLQEGIRATAMLGGDSDTNAAVAGALLGAAHGIDDVPSPWIEALHACQPAAHLPGVRRARPFRYWPPVAMTLAPLLLRSGEAAANRLAHR